MNVISKQTISKQNIAARVLRRRGRERRDLPLTGLIIVGLFVLLALVGSFIAPMDPTSQDLANRLAPPSATHLLGTDAFGRDVLSRILVATRIDLPIGVAAASISAILGMVIGGAGGYLGGVLDTLLMRLGDLIMAFPTYVLIVALIAIIGPGVPAILVSFAIVGWVSYARLLREEVRRVRRENYVTAAYLAGIPPLVTLARHVMPNAIRPVLAYFVMDVMMAILTLAALSYLGLGIQPPTPEWGTMVAEGQAYIQTKWWLTAAPGAMIAGLGLGLLLLGEALERRLKA